MSRRAFIWDLDGTFLDSYEVIVSCLYTTLSEFGIELDREEIYNKVKTDSADSLIRDVEAKYGIPFDVIKDRNSKISNLCIDKIGAIKNAEEILSYLKENRARNYVFTHRGNSSAQILSNLGLIGYFDEIVTGKDGFPRKPDPAAINYLVKKYGLDPWNTFYVGDRAIDMECADNAGIKSILYLPADSVVIPTGKETYTVKDLLGIKECLHLEGMIAEALSAYGMENARYELIRRNENITCRVKHGKGLYALRIHSPVGGFRKSFVKGDLSDTELFESEADLLVYMSKNGFEGLQAPVADLEGRYVSKLKCGAPVMMLTWIDGRPLEKEEMGLYASECAKLACRIHGAAKGFTGKRIRYDEDLCVRMADEIRLAVSEGHVTEEQGEICVRELDAVKAAMKRLPSLSEPAVIHADLGPDNILLTEKGLVPIDFSFSGFGHPAEEAGMLISNFRNEDEIRKALDGFCEAGEQVDERDARIFMSFFVLSFICLRHEGCHREEWYGNAMKRWCDELFID